MKEGLQVAVVCVSTCDASTAQSEHSRKVKTHNKFWMSSSTVASANSSYASVFSRPNLSQASLLSGTGDSEDAEHDIDPASSKLNLPAAANQPSNSWCGPCFDFLGYSRFPKGPVGKNSKLREDDSEENDPEENDDDSHMITVWIDRMLSRHPLAIRDAYADSKFKFKFSDSLTTKHLYRKLDKYIAQSSHPIDDDHENVLHWIDVHNDIDTQERKEILRTDKLPLISLLDAPTPRLDFARPAKHIVRNLKAEPAKERVIHFLLETRPKQKSDAAEAVDAAVGNTAKVSSGMDMGDAEFLEAAVSGLRLPDRLQPEFEWGCGIEPGCSAVSDAAQSDTAVSDKAEPDAVSGGESEKSAKSNASAKSMRSILSNGPGKSERARGSVSVSADVNDISEQESLSNLLGVERGQIKPSLRSDRRKKSVTFKGTKTQHFSDNGFVGAETQTFAEEGFLEEGVPNRKVEGA